ncbi:MAG: hypothetical protein ACJ735_00510 [Actinomycetes bacterium]
MDEMKVGHAGHSNLREVTGDVITKLTGAMEAFVLTVAPSGGQGTARRNALRAAAAARATRWERAEAFALLERATTSEMQPAAS